MTEPVLPSAHLSPQPKGKSIGSAISAQLTAENPYTLQWAAPFPKTALDMGDLEPHLTWFMISGPIRANNLNGISIGLAIFAQMTAECPYTLQWDAVFAGLTSVTDRQTMLLGW